MPLARRLIHVIAATSIATAATAFPVAAAQAAPEASPGCEMSSLSQPFLAWGDSSTYVLVPGSDGSLAGWTLTGGAAQVSGGYGGGSALGLASGDVATAPGACVNIPHPTARFFVRTDTPGAVVQVAAIHSTPDGTVAIPTGTVDPGTSWAPSSVVKVHPVVLPALFGGTAYVTLQFTVSGGTAQIDDVYVDPYRSG